MYIFFGDGELGNQLFQYRFIQGIFKKKNYLITSNFKDIKTFLKIDKKIKLINFENKFFVFFLRKIFIFVLYVLSYLKLINSINVPRNKIFETKIEKNSLEFKRGLINITFIFPRFFQSEYFFQKKKKIVIKNQFKFKALNFIQKIPKKFELVFIHYRQGKDKDSKNFGLFGSGGLHKNDYKDIKFLGLKGIELPNSYYFRQISFFNKKLKKPYFIILTDNEKKAAKNFKYLKHKTISKNNIFVDLCIMIICRNGILSNSSISWWGGYLMTKKKYLFAPKYWLGWKRRIVFQTGGEPKFAKLIDINKL